MTVASPTLSKSRFTAGLQCHKQLWWRVHEPDAKELVPTVGGRHQMDQGLEVGRRARDYVPGGVAIEIPGWEYERRVAATVQALVRGAPVIYEATFIADDVVVQADILERLPNGAYGLIEVKASTSAKPEHIPDVAVQLHVVRRAGVNVQRAEVMHLNPDCRYPDLSNLFVRQDVTPEAEAVAFGVPEHVQAQLAALAGPLPRVSIGEHCTKPRDCPFLDRCWGILPKHHVTELYGIRFPKVDEFRAKGYETVFDLPSDVALSAIHARQVRAVRTERMIVEPGLGLALEPLRPPLAYLDFETVRLAIPRWDGCRPWDQVPAQWSCHVEGRHGRLAHHEWIADGPADPRPELAARLVEACRDARAVATYSSFEAQRIHALAAAVPSLAGELEVLEHKLVDLLPVVRNHVYHPAFGGSFGIKSVLPALAPTFTYDDLPINEGDAASAELLRLMLGRDHMPTREWAALRRNLLAYCARDTLAMVKLLERLRGLTVAQLELF